MKITVLGMGSWGMALASVLHDNGHDITIWGRNKEKVRQMNDSRISSEYLPGFTLNEAIHITNDLEGACKDQGLIVLSVSSQSVRQVIESIDPFISEGQMIVSTSKGLERDTFRLMSEVIESASHKTRAVVLSGPSHAEEVAMGLPTTCVVASSHENLAKKAQDIFMHPRFRVYINEDIVGVELGGALKNIISLAAGISDGMGYGDNTKAALITRGLVEIARLGVKMGATEKTFNGLSGMGDLIVTCISTHSRNWKTGYLLGQGQSLDEALETVHMVVEGIYTTQAAFHLAEKYQVSMPITTEIYKTLFEDKSPTEAVNDLMTRDKGTETIEQL